MNRNIDTWLSELNSELEQLKFGSYPEELYEPITYMLSLGGKRMRPLLTLLAYGIRKDDWQSIVKPALAVELFHNFTLIHDDIMDEAPLRRGRATVHSKWNKNIAILSGDTMMIQAIELLLEAQTEDLRYILKCFNKCATEVCEGQQLDMNFERENHIQEIDYLNMVMLKTAVLLGFSLELGGLLGGMGREEAARLRCFGVRMGIGFQLKDDLLDVYGKQESFGKQVGGDIIANKKTYLLVRALEMANPSQKLRLQFHLSNDDFDPEEKVAAVTELYDEIGVKEETEQKMKLCFEKAFNTLDQLEESEQAVAQLINFTHKVIDRHS